MLSPLLPWRLPFGCLVCAIHAGGAQIIDAMILVIDIVKGIQTQTAECIVLGEVWLLGVRVAIGASKWHSCPQG